MWFSIPLALVASVAFAVPLPSDPAAIRLTDQSGRGFTIREIANAPVVATFVSTQCTDVCPLVSATFAKLQADLGRRGERVLLLTVTLDPRHDTPRVMARYAKRFGAEITRWRVASGSPANVEALLDALHVDRAGDEDHSTFVYVFDTHGKLAAVLPFSSNLETNMLTIIGRGR